MVHYQNYAELTVMSRPPFGLHKTADAYLNKEYRRWILTSCGELGIRTPKSLRTPVFKTGAIAVLPALQILFLYSYGRLVSRDAIAVLPVEAIIFFWWLKSPFFLGDSLLTIVINIRNFRKRGKVNYTLYNEWEAFSHSLHSTQFF